MQMTWVLPMVPGDCMTDTCHQLQADLKVVTACSRWHVSVMPTPGTVSRSNVMAVPPYNGSTCSGVAPYCKPLLPAVTKHCSVPDLSHDEHDHPAPQSLSHKAHQVAYQDI